METKLITKTIKELADEYDGNVEQLHRTIGDQNVQIKYLNNENDDLRRDIRLEQFARENAEKKSEVSTFVMMLCLIVSTIAFVINMLFIG